MAGNSILFLFRGGDLFFPSNIGPSIICWLLCAEPSTPQPCCHRYPPIPPSRNHPVPLQWLYSPLRRDRFGLLAWQSLSFVESRSLEWRRRDASRAMNRPHPASILSPQPTPRHHNPSVIAPHSPDEFAVQKKATVTVGHRRFLATDFLASS